MESPQFIVYIYSKYSSNCKDVLDKIRNNNLYFINTLCIDNIEIRNKIKQSKLELKYVPTLLLYYSNGNVEKFEGERCGVWVKEILDKINPNANENLDSNPNLRTPIVQQEFIPPKPKMVEKSVKEEKSRLSTKISDLPTIEEVENIKEENEEETVEIGIKSNLEFPAPDSRPMNIDTRPTTSIPQKTSGKPLDILSKAKEMQKMRDTEESLNKQNRPKL